MFRAQQPERFDSNVVAQAVRTGMFESRFHLVTRQQCLNFILPTRGEVAKQVVIEPAQQRAERKEAEGGHLGRALRPVQLFHVCSNLLSCVAEWRSCMSEGKVRLIFNTRPAESADPADPAALRIP